MKEEGDIPGLKEKVGVGSGGWGEKGIVEWVTKSKGCIKQHHRNFPVSI